jgi:endonuclease/exonuclease/phosphatase family metal-dependent hydrolase
LTQAACLVLFLASGLSPFAQPTNTFTVASYNVENWLAMERYGKPDQPKPRASKEGVMQILVSVRPDVLGLCEVGTTNDFAEIALGLNARGLDYPHREWIQGGDQVRHVALLSRFPIAERHSRADYAYDLEGQPRRIERGILDVTVQVNDGYSFRAVLVHLKSKRVTEEGDQAVMRLNEARLLRQHVESALERNPRLNLLVMGDLNDTPDSEPIRTVIGGDPMRLFDLHPLDSQGADGTHFWRARREFSRIDYLLASPGMSNEFVSGSARIADVEGWDKASDHRAVSARFHDREIGEPAVVPTTLQPAQPANRALLVYVILIGVGGLAMIAIVGYRLLRSSSDK